jgi:NADPH2:quinone reductase
VNLIAQRSIGLDKSVGVGHLQRGVRAGRTFEVEQDLLQAAKAAGASVVAVAAGREKLALVRELGADAVVDYQEVESLSAAVREATAGRGVDVVFDPVGGADAREQLRCLAWGGRYLTIGFAAGEIPTVKVNQTIMKGISVIGVAYGMSAVLDPGARTLRT